MRHIREELALDPVGILQSQFDGFALSDFLLECLVGGLQGAVFVKQLSEHCDFRLQDGRIYGLGHVVYRSGAVAREKIPFIIVVGSQEDDRDVARFLAAFNDPCKFNPVHSGHLHIQHNEGKLGAQERQ